MHTVASRDNTRIAFWCSGNGPPLLLVHGATYNHTTAWRFVVPELERQFTVYAMDRRGRGASGDSPAYELRREAEDVAAVVESIGEPVNLLGHSYGALCAVEAALLGANLRRLILYEGVPLRGADYYAPGMIERLEALLDGTRVVFSTDWEGPPNLYIADVDGGEPRVLVPFDRTQQFAGGWTPDGKQVVYTKRNDTFGMDIWVVDVSTGAHQPILATPFQENRPAVSPNGRWLAYASNASGRQEVYVREFPKGTWQIRMSMDGGTDPVWRDDGQELFYYQPDGVIMAVPIESGAAGRPAVGVPTRLFGIDPRAYRSFNAASGGRRFLMNLIDPESLSRPDDVAINWPRLLRQR